MSAADLAAIDRAHMDHALRLGRRGLGLTWPNPSVGCVVVKGGRIVGRGHTQPGGRPHAEAVALDRAGLQAAGATLYVTLEPCAFRSVRGGIPCVERVLLAGVTRLVSAIADPHPQIAGVSHALLRTAGLAVTLGIGGEQAALDHRGHFSRVTRGRPFIQVKLAVSADGFVAGPGGETTAITGEETRRAVHLMRAEADAIMVGIGTVLADDPQLTCRLPGLEARSPVRVVVDSDLKTPLASQLVTTASLVPTWIVAGEGGALQQEAALRDKGVEVLRVARDASRRVRLEEAVQLLATRGITRLMVEGGPRLAAGFAREGLIDEAVIFDSPKILRRGMPAFADLSREEALAGLHPTDHIQCGADIRRLYRR